MTPLEARAAALAKYVPLIGAAGGTDVVVVNQGTCVLARCQAGGQTWQRAGETAEDALAYLLGVIP
jgi:hypothetical protein